VLTLDSKQQFVCRELERQHVAGAGQNLAKNESGGLVDLPSWSILPSSSFRNALDNLNVLAMHVGVKAAEAGSTGSGSADPCCRRVRQPQPPSDRRAGVQDADVLFAQNRRRAL
jgi:hypothetical protein